ncbi:PAS domain-containing sensor histidine kinase [Arcobacter roscoffensis]|uniref:histidine kinase n=1 Tax=Arcobacter roscoffensis TaxID=2961520 RepID=A0ABY5E2D9_9BACT|nr:PAS domain-containing protein [Arcobacter roscoffensis]UTJ06346.1 PAS domain-containing protein [Arcobacter roscoffensis]
MVFKKKKFYTLSDIKNQIVYTPLLFVIILAVFSSFVVFFFYKYQEINKVKLLEQRENFYNQNILSEYISLINIKRSEKIDSQENNLIKYVYEVKGYTRSFLLSNKAIDYEILENYIYNLEQTQNVEFILFDAIRYDVLHGHKILEYLRKQTNSKIVSEKFNHFMLRNIQYNSNDNMTYWIDSQKREVRLSYFNFIDSNGLMLGVYSKVDDLKALTKQAILTSLSNSSKLEEKAHFVFYDINEKVVYNYNGENKKILVKDINRFDLLDNNNFVYTFPKYNYKVIVKNNYIEKRKKEIKLDQEHRMLIGIFLILFIAILLITTANIFGRFINTIFNRYNKRLERKNLLLTKWKDRYELAIIASNDGLWDVNLKTNKIFFSNKWLNMFGYKRDEIQNFKEWLTLVHEDDKPEVLKKFSEHVEGHSEHFICEYRLRDKRGDYKWVLVRGKAFIDENESRMLMMSMDIDDRMNLTKELRDVELLTEFGRIVIFRWQNNEDLTVKFVSKSIETYGYSPLEFIDTNSAFFSFVYEKDVLKLQNRISKAINNDESSFTSIHRVIDKQKNIKWVYNRTILVKDDYGQVTSLYGYLNDITKIKMNEEDLKIRVKEEVEKNIEKDRMLIQQNKMASMGEMLGNIAHQWRQPLNNINLLIHFIRDNFKNFTKEDLHESVASAKLQIDYMSQTIDDFRNFYQPTKDKKIFDIKQSLVQSSKIVATSFEQNSVDLEILGDKVEIENYENEFEQVIVNILNNAVDAAIIKKKEEKFNPKVLINIKKNEDLIISISNNCGKVKKEVLDRMFEPYFTTKFENQGTGIGLYMAKIIVEKNMKGKIEAFNKDDGVEFIIKLSA